SGSGGPYGRPYPGGYGRGGYGPGGDGPGGYGPGGYGPYGPYGRGPMPPMPGQFGQPQGDVRPGQVVLDEQGRFDIWAHDENAQPGKTYVYRMRVVIKNP